ncbi:hypothetical protein TNCV_465781 [Trichonephila clavipes]|nr:hypothetical protein TNCV_465781 [Trichonephila clavipes]
MGVPTFSYVIFKFTCSQSIPDQSGRKLSSVPLRYQYRILEKQPRVYENADRLTKEGSEDETATGTSLTYQELYSNDFPEVINSIVVIKIPNLTDISLAWVPF